MKYFLKQLILAKVGFFAWVTRPFRKGSEIVVMMYHSISDASWEFSLSPTGFQQQMESFHRRGYIFLNADDLWKIVTRQAPAPCRGVLVTFDDGYADMLSILPVLKKYQIPALLFVHGNRNGKVLGNSFPLLNWEQIRMLQQEGVTIGSHSYAHPNLRNLTASEVHTDMQAAELAIEEHLGSRPLYYAYPGGKMGSTSQQYLREHQYRLAFSIDRGLVHPGDDPMKIKRLGVSRSMSWLEFLVRTTTASDWYEKLTRMFT